MEYIKAVVDVVEFECDDVIVTSECLTNLNMEKEMGIECDGVTQHVDKTTEPTLG